MKKLTQNNKMFMCLFLGTVMGIISSSCFTNAENMLLQRILARQEQDLNTMKNIIEVETTALTNKLSELQYQLNVINATGNAITKNIKQSDELDFSYVSVDERTLSENIEYISTQISISSLKMSILKDMVNSDRTESNYIPELYGDINSSFGYRIDPVSGDHSIHKGVDIRKPYGSPIYAPATGIVIFSGWYGDYGNVIEIDHGNGYTTLFAHNSSNLVNVGDIVKRTTIIARVGDTGKATGPHMHIEIKKNGVTINPSKYTLAEAKRPNPLG